MVADFSIGEQAAPTRGLTIQIQPGDDVEQHLAIGRARRKNQSDDGRVPHRTDHWREKVQPGAAFHRGEHPYELWIAVKAAHRNSI